MEAAPSTGLSDGPSMTSRRLVMYKSSAEQKLGLSLYADAEDGDIEGPVKVRKVADQSLAFHAGLLIEDEVKQINGVSVKNALTAAATLRDSMGELWLSIERDLHAVLVPSDEDDENEPPVLLSPKFRRTGRFAEDNHSSSNNGEEDRTDEDDESYEEDEDEEGDEYSYSDEEEEGDDHAQDEEEYADATVDEWEDWLEWMIGKIAEREAELKQLQSETADALVSSMGSDHNGADAASSPLEQPPSPPSDSEMADAEAMEKFMMAMALYSTRQQARIKAMASEASENQEATAAIALLCSRRRELEGLLGRVEELTDDDAARVEYIWKELAREGEGEGEVEEVEHQQQHEQQTEAAADSDADDEVDRILMGGAYKPNPVRAAAPPLVRKHTDKEKGEGEAPPVSSPLRTLTAVDVNSLPKQALSDRVVAKGGGGGGAGAKQESLIAQRLQRARSSGTLKMAPGARRPGALADPWLHEVGCKIAPV